jgi:hypothetical protein
VTNLNINEVYIRLNNNENFQFKEQSAIDFYCSSCKRHLVKISLVNGKRIYKGQQKYLYYDGDTIDIPKKYFLKANTSMMFGSCESCGNTISLINAVILNENLNNDDLIEDFKNCFMVFSEDDMISDFKEAKQYSIILHDITIGKVVIYKDAIINKNGVHGLKNNVKRDIALATLECLSENEKMNISNIGICNGHFENENQWEIWQEASEITEQLINSVEELL